MGKLTTYGTVLLGLFTLSNAQLEQRAQQIPQLFSRDTYNGGWAIGLDGSACPSDAPVACDTNGGYVNPTCCPKSQKCFGYASPYCCPGNTDCINVVTNFPVCATSGWNLYIYNANRNLYFCCPPGQFGVLPVSGNAGICKPEDTRVVSSLIATPVAATTDGAGPVSTSTFIRTSTSTLRGGSVTIVTEEATAVETSPSETSTDEEDPGNSSSSGSSGTRKSSKAKKKGKLSTGVIAAIAIGAAILLLIVLLALWWRRRKAKKSALNQTPETYIGGQGHAPMYDNSNNVPRYDGEHKSPAVSSIQAGGYGGQQMGYAGTPPATHTVPVGGYGGPPPHEGPAPVRYEERAEMGTGRN